MTYPKEVLDALERDHGIRFTGEREGDGRFCYGATCTWFGSIHEVGGKGPHQLPCCPLCGGMLFEMPDEGHWWKGVDDYEKSQPYPGYRAMWEWQRAQKKCFPLRDGIKGLEAAYRASTPRDGKQP